MSALRATRWSCVAIQAALARALPLDTIWKRVVHAAWPMDTHRPDPPGAGNGKRRARAEPRRVIPAWGRDGRRGSQGERKVAGCTAMRTQSGISIPSSFVLFTALLCASASSVSGTLFSIWIHTTLAFKRGGRPFSFRETIPTCRVWYCHLCRRRHLRIRQLLRVLRESRFVLVTQLGTKRVI